MDLDGLKDEVAEGNGVKTVEIYDLMHYCGFERLGKNVPARMTELIRGIGLRHIPMKLPQERGKSVRVYDPSSAVGKLIALVLRPGEGEDQRLVELSGDGPALILGKIRELVNEE